MNVEFLTEQGIPERLRTIAQPPHGLYILGDLEALLRRPCLSVVGSRKPTAYGRQVTEKLVSELAGKGIVIVSGLAFGIDSIAHRACLAAGGQTVAVLPGGVENVYPTSHHQLADQILAQGGALVSEYAGGTPAFKLNFVERNRLVSGLGDGLLVIEAAAKSGTLHTVDFADDQQRTVMAVPGNITSPLSAGTNTMLKNHALPVTDSNDVLLALGLTVTQIAEHEILAATSEEGILIKLLRTGTTDVTQLQVFSQLEPARFNQTLTMLEITGKIRPLGAGHWALN